MPRKKWHLNAPFRQVVLFEVIQVILMRGDHQLDSGGTRVGRALLFGLLFLFLFLLSSLVPMPLREMEWGAWQGSLEREGRARSLWGGHIPAESQHVRGVRLQAGSVSEPNWCGQVSEEGEDLAWDVWAQMEGVLPQGTPAIQCWSPSEWQGPPWSRGRAIAG